MQVRYTVHSCVREKVAVEATFKDRPLIAHVDGLVVELVSDDGAMGHTFRFMADEVTAGDLLLLQPRAKLVMTLTAAAAE